MKSHIKNIAMPASFDEDIADLESASKFCQWATPDGASFSPVHKTLDKLPPDVYEINAVRGQLVFSRLNFSKENLLKFEESNIDKVVNDIQTFWSKEGSFKEFGLPFRRGILLHGPQGSGKTSTIKLIVNDVIEREGIAIKFSQVGVFIAGIRALRSIQPSVPVVCIMEDLDSITKFNSSEVLNLLDGIDQIDKIVYLATTNYPQDIEPRFGNRPSRFDRRYLIDNPGDASRRMYIEFLCSKSTKSKEINIDKWVTDTKGLSIAHIKELFISVNLFDYDYQEAISDLKKMGQEITSEKYSPRKSGFMLSAEEDYA